MEWATLLAGFLIGVLSGAISGSLGIGGSSITIVMLRVLLGLGGSAAVATALPLSIPSAAGGTAVYLRKKMVKLKTVLTCGISGSVFSVAGAFATAYVPGNLIMLMVAFVLLLFAYNAYRECPPGKKKCSAKQSLREKAAYSVLVGAVAGFTSGFLGIGGGIILVPLLARFRKMGYKKAIPCSLCIMLIYVIPASVTHFSLGHVEIPLLLALAGGAAVGAVVGARRMAEAGEREIRTWFAAILGFFGVLLLLNEAGILRLLTG